MSRCRFFEKNISLVLGVSFRDFPLFLRGVLENVVCRTWCFYGENVVIGVRSLILRNHNV
jgi:hypothetical protein